MVKIAAAIHKSDVGGVALSITTPQAAAPGDEPRAVPAGSGASPSRSRRALRSVYRTRPASTRSWPGRRPSSLRSGGPGAGTASAGLPDGSGAGWGLAAMTITLDGSSQYGLPSPCCAAPLVQRAKVPSTTAG